MGEGVDLIGGITSIAIMFVIIIISVYIYNYSGLKKLTEKLWKRILKLPYTLRRIIYALGIAIWVVSIVVVIVN